MLDISIIALVVSSLALPFTVWAAYATAKQADAARTQTDIQREQVSAAREQTKLQRELAGAASQPYVWADIRPDMQQGSMLQVVVGNSGPTMARNVRVTFEPPLPTGTQHAERILKIELTLAAGLKSLAPQRVIQWTLGVGRELLASEASQLCTVRIGGDGPHGPLPVLATEIDISQWREARDAPDGSLHHVRGAIKDHVKAVQEVSGSIERGVDQAR